MASALTPSQLAAIEARLSQHPEMLKALKADAAKFGGKFQYEHPNDPRARQGPADILKQYGIDFPDAEDYQIQVDPAGQVKLQRSNWFQRNADWVLPVATIATAGLASGLAGATGPTAGATDAGYVSSAVNGVENAITPAATSTLGKVAGLAAKYGGVAGSAISSATNAAGQNRIDEATRAQNFANAEADRKLQAQRDAENALQGRSKLESDQRNQANKDVYRAGWYANRQSSPFNPMAPQPIGDAATTSMNELADQGSAQLATGPQYGTNTMPGIAPYVPTPYTPSQPGTLEQVGTWAGPLLSAFDAKKRLEELNRRKV